RRSTGISRACSAGRYARAGTLGPTDSTAGGTAERRTGRSGRTPAASAGPATRRTPRRRPRLRGAWTGAHRPCTRPGRSTGTARLSGAAPARHPRTSSRPRSGGRGARARDPRSRRGPPPPARRHLAGRGAAARHLIVRHARVHLKGRTDGLDDTDTRVLAADAQQLEVLTGVLRPQLGPAQLEPAFQVFLDQAGLERHVGGVRELAADLHIAGADAQGPVEQAVARLRGGGHA